MRGLSPGAQYFVVLSEAKDLLVLRSNDGVPKQNGGALATRAAQHASMRTYYVYILASKSRRMYIGVTGNIMRRVAMHRDGEIITTARYRMVRLVHVETTNDVRAAIAREKQLKGWLRGESSLSSANTIRHGTTSRTIGMRRVGERVQRHNASRSFAALRTTTQAGPSLRSGRQRKQVLRCAQDDNASRSFASLRTTKVFAALHPRWTFQATNP
jgi:putative endonuclease